LPKTQRFPFSNPTSPSKNINAKRLHCTDCEQNLHDRNVWNKHGTDVDVDPVAANNARAQHLGVGSRRRSDYYAVGKSWSGENSGNRVCVCCMSVVRLQTNKLFFNTVAKYVVQNTRFRFEICNSQ